MCTVSEVTLRLCLLFQVRWEPWRALGTAGIRPDLKNFLLDYRGTGWKQEPQ